ncbi:uncharacterized protein LOC141677298 isoform X3 [Apium graveolens]|uniref:uncharacterized protein LOC141677298 isoform X3 n=1 Tax=Apium graveolens TaxID=4045 RepID=UPI003D7ADFE3
MRSWEVDGESADLECEIDNVQGMVDALSSVRWKRHQDAVIELSEHGIVLVVEDSSCLQAKVYLQKELFVRYEYSAQARVRFGVSLGLFVDSLNTFSLPAHSSTIQIRYPGPDMQLLLKSVDSLDACIYAEIRTRIPETISWDYNFEPAGSTPLSFTVKSAALKEAIDDLEWPGSSIQESHRYKYKFLRATTSNIPSSVIKENRGSKFTIGRGGMLKVQHLVSVAKPSNSHSHADSAGYLQPSRIAYIEFFVKPEVGDVNADD